jgi:exonuclease III
MKIMSLNAWGGTLVAPLLDYLRAEAPDILCLQETIHTPASAKDWLEYRDGDRVLPQRANLFREVAAVLPGHVATFCPAAEGELWDGPVAVPSRWGLATFVHDGLAVTEQVQAFVHRAFSPDGYGEHPRSRNAHALRVYDFAAPRFVTVAHMHGLRDRAGKGDTPERLLQARRFRDLVAGLVQPGDAVVACGDFNVEPGSETFAVLGELGLRELVTAGGWPGTRTSQYTKPGRFADYMLVGQGTEVRSFAVVTAPEVSDHCPLVLEL